MELSPLAFSPSRALPALGLPVVLIPWVVLQELDSLKRGRGLSGSVAHLATPAISYIYNTLKGRESNLWGQSMQQASESSSKCGFQEGIWYFPCFESKDGTLGLKFKSVHELISDFYWELLGHNDW